MNKEEYEQEVMRLAVDIIDEVSDLIEKEYDLKPQPQEDNDNPALLYGETYYHLEETIIQKIKKFLKKNGK